MERPQLKECMAYARAGDEIFIHELARLARSLLDLRSLVDFFTRKGCVVHFTKEALTFSPGNAKPMEKLMLNLLGSLAEFERELIRERQAEGIALAKVRGVYKRRKKKLTLDQVQEIREQVAEGDLLPLDDTTGKLVKSVSEGRDGHEEEAVYRPADHRVLEGSRSGNAGEGFVTQARFQRRGFLQVAREVRRNAARELTRHQQRVD